MSSCIINLKRRKPFLFTVTVCLIIITFILPVAAHAANEIPASSAAPEQIDHIVREELSKAKTPNAVIAIIQGNGVEYLSSLHYDCYDKYAKVSGKR